MPINPNTGVLETSLQPADLHADLIVGVAWLGSAYIIGLIFTACRLVSRWQGTLFGEPRPISGWGIAGAFIVSIAWPFVLLTFLFTGGKVA